MSCRLTVAMNCYPLTWKSLEGEGISEYKGDHPGKHSRPTGELHVYNKKKTLQGGGRVGRMSKSQVQQNASQKENGWNERRKKSATDETIPIHLKHSSDGKYYFGWWPFCHKEWESCREMRKGLRYSTVDVRENCNHLWLTWDNL